MRCKTVAMFLTALVLSTPMYATSQGGTYIPEDMQKVADYYAEEYSVSRYLLYSLIEKKSSGNQYAVSPSGTCKGPMQINPASHKSRMEKLGYTTAQVFELEANIHTGTDYLVDIRYDSGIDDIYYVLDVYNGNSKAKSNYEKGIKTNYSSKIVNRAIELEWFYEMECQERKEL